MRIGYNCRFLQGPLTGVQRIAQDLFDALTRPDSGNEYVAFLCGRGGRHIAALDRPNVETVGGDSDVSGRLRRQAWEQETLPRLVRRAGVDVMHHPANTAPRRHLERAVVSIYDTSFLAHPEWFSRSFQWYYRWLIPRIARNADRLITCSRFSKGELVERLGVEPTRIEVVYPGVSPWFLAQAGRSRPTDGVPAGVRRRTRGDKPPVAHEANRPPTVRAPEDAAPFVLFVGGTNPRKNLARLVEAMRLLRARPALADVALQVVGGSPDIFRRREPASDPAAAGVEFLGDVSEQRLADLYRTAACLCYPSVYEGFGLPPLEALAVRTPVVAADIPVLREVLADAAVFANPASPEALADALARLLDDDALRRDLVRRGAERVETFTYEAAATRTLEIYQDVAGM